MINTKEYIDVIITTAQNRYNESKNRYAGPLFCTYTAEKIFLETLEDYLKLIKQ